MESKWVQDYDFHKTRGEIEWLPEGEVPWKDELGELEKKCIEGRAARIADNKEKEEMAKIEAKKTELLGLYSEKKRKDALNEEILAMSKALGIEVPKYVAPVPAPAPKPEPVKVVEPVKEAGHVEWLQKEEKPVEVKTEAKPKKKVFGRI